MAKLLRFVPGSVGQYFEGWQWDGKCAEVYASTCAHCQGITELPSLRRKDEFIDICRSCMKLICQRCAGKPCLPAEMECERIEREARIKRRIEQGAWGCY